MKDFFVRVPLLIEGRDKESVAQVADLHLQRDDLADHKAAPSYFLFPSTPYFG